MILELYNINDLNVLLESYRNQERQFIRQSCRRILFWIKDIMNRVGPRELIAFSSTPNLLNTLSIKNEGYAHSDDINPSSDKLQDLTIKVHVKYTSGDQYKLNMGGTFDRSKSKSVKGKIDRTISINIFITLNPDNHVFNLRLFKQDMLQLNEKLYESITHELEHGKQDSKGEVPWTDSTPYFERPYEIEAYVKGFLNSWRKFSVGNPMQKVSFPKYVYSKLKGYSKSSAKIHAALGKPLSTDEESRLLDNQGLNKLYNSLMDYTATHHPKINISNRKNYSF